MRPLRTSRFFGALISISIMLEITALQHDAPLSMRAHLQAEGKSRLQNHLPAADETTPRISLIFTGDINLGRCVAKETIIAADFTHPFRFVAEKLRSADITIGSLDGTISNQSHFMSCPDSTNLIGPEGMVQGLQFAGFDVITVGNQSQQGLRRKRI